MDSELAIPSHSDPSSRSPRAIRLATAAFGAALLSVAWLVAWQSMTAISLSEGIFDQRASQTTLLFGCWLLALWCTGTAANALVDSAPVRAKSLRAAMLGSSGSRRLIGAFLGVCGTTLVTSVVLIAIAGLPMFVVTPPAAWLIMTPATGLGGVLGARALGQPATGQVDGMTHIHQNSMHIGEDGQRANLTDD